MSLELSKGISYGTMVVLVLAIIAGSMAYGKTQKTIEIVETASTQHVTKESVNQLLAVRDTKLEAIEENINEIKLNQREFQVEQRAVNREQQRLLIKILGKLPDE